MSVSPIHYTVRAINPNAHLWQVDLTIQTPDPNGQALKLPNWIPGSYMIRDFAKNVVTISAQTLSGSSVSVQKQNKSTWVCGVCNEPLQIQYTVYAWDLSVRSAHLDQTHGYFNGTSLFLEVVNQSDQPCLVTLEKPAGNAYQNWRVATTLKENQTSRFAFGDYLAENYDDLIDHPVEMGEFTLASFEACGIPHDVVLAGRHQADTERLCRDLKTICEYHIRFFGEPAPMERYLFMTLVVGDGYGGLEHRSSTSLICSRDDLPHKNDGDKITDGYRTYLGLCSHEYFHTWNVKRIKPARFFPYELQEESHTQLLWVFEGFTSYFDDLSLFSSGLITAEEYLGVLGKTISNVLQCTGRLKQSVAASSFDTWTKFYKQDENAINAIVSYYTKGSLVALALDLKIRSESGFNKDLSDVMRYLWANYGLKQKGVEENEMPAIITASTGVAIDDFLLQMTHGTEDLPLKELFEIFGVHFGLRAATSSTDLGGKKADDPALPYFGIKHKNSSIGLEILAVKEDSPAQQAGLSAGDQIIAMDYLKVDSSSFDKRLLKFNSGDQMTISYFRRDELMTAEVTLSTPVENVCFLEISDEEKLKKWLAPCNQ